jgi:hypothetical protein
MRIGGLGHCMSRTKFGSLTSIISTYNDYKPINPLKTQRICVIQGLSPYRAVNTLHLGYKNRTVKVA